MPIFKKNQKYFKKIIIFQIFSIFFTSSCTLKNFNQNDEWNFIQAKNQLQELIVPKDLHCFIKNKEYTVPYQDKDLEKKNYSILPPT